MIMFRTVYCCCGLDVEMARHGLIRFAEILENVARVGDADFLGFVGCVHSPEYI